MSFRPSLLYLPTLMISVWMGLLTSCQNPVSPGYDPGAFKLEEGFSLKLVAGPDLVRTPVAMDQDVQGRLWVLEMPGYMADLASSTEEAAVGKIKILTDENGDGIFDRSASFLDSLVLARALLLVYDGLLYAEPPNLWFVPILEGDQAGPKELVDSVYATGGNVEHQANSLTYNLDNWIYNAKSTFRYQRKNGVWKKERTAFRGQWGLSRDDVGRLYSNNNSRTLVADMVSPAFFKPYPGLQLSHLYNQEIDTSFRVYPLHPTAVNRGYIPGVLDSAGLLQRVTSACGPLVYRGHQFPETYQNRAFVCTPEANALQAYQLSEQGPRLQAMHASPGREFLASTEEIFRPVNAYNNARGTLYINDIHQGIIQHFTYMTSYLRNQLQASGLDSAAQGGRIWEISYQAEQAPSMPRLVGRPMQDWVELLRHPNGWIRDKAQAYLVHQGDAAAVPELVALIEGHQANPLGALHAMWTLEGMGALTAAHLLPLCESAHDHLVGQALGLMTRMPKPLPFFMQEYVKRPTPTKDFYLLLANPEAFFPLPWKKWLSLTERYLQEGSGLHREAALQGALGAPSVPGPEGQPSLIQPLLVQVADIRQQPLLARTQSRDTPTHGSLLYREHCGSCHGPTGEGIALLGPPLYESEYVSQSTARLLGIVLHGLEGPITVKGKLYDDGVVMPGLAANQALSDQEIANMLNFVRNAFGTAPQNIRPEMVKKARQSSPPDGALYRAETLPE